MGNHEEHQTRDILWKSNLEWSKNVKSCSVSVVIWAMQIKATAVHCSILPRLTKVKMSDNTSVGMWEMGAHVW